MSERYGRTADEWQELIDATANFLIERARLRKDTSYTELNAVLAQRTGHKMFDFSNPADRGAVGHLLGAVVEQTYDEEHPVMLSALVTFLNEKKPGQGFFDLAMHRGLLPRGASEEEKDAFWYQQMDTAFTIYRRRKRRGI